MTEQRQHVRYQVEFPAIFSGDHAGIGIVYNLGMGGCKVVSAHVNGDPSSPDPECPRVVDAGLPQAHRHLPVI